MLKKWFSSKRQKFVTPEDKIRHMILAKNPAHMPAIVWIRAFYKNGVRYEASTTAFTLGSALWGLLKKQSCDRVVIAYISRSMYGEKFEMTVALKDLAEVL